MRILFVSGVSEGGAPRSTLELAEGLRARGHEVDVILGDRTLASPLYQLGVRAAVKSEATPLGRPIVAVLRRMDRKERDSPLGSAVLAPIAVNAARARLMNERMDVVVGNSLPRIEMQWAVDDAHANGARFIAYLRETHAVTHFTMTGLRPDAVVANARSLAEQITGLVHCEVIPSLVELSGATVATTCETVVLVNPVPANRPDFFLEMAGHCPEIRFVLQESWQLDPEDRARLEAACAARPNVELRRRTARPADVYRDARILVAPYDYGRPRVVAEAQHNGIPVLAFDHPILAEAVGTGGVLVSPSSTPREAAEALRSMWDEPRYAQLRAAALEHARREEIDPDHIVDRFERVLLGATRDV